jgi:hypothetical protein
VAVQLWLRTGTCRKIDLESDKGWRDTSKDAKPCLARGGLFMEPILTSGAEPQGHHRSTQAASALWNQFHRAGPAGKADLSHEVQQSPLCDS